MSNDINLATEIIGKYVNCGWYLCERRRGLENGKFPPLDACGNTNPSCRDVAEGIAQDLADAGIL